MSDLTQPGRTLGHVRIKHQAGVRGTLTASIELDGRDISNIVRGYRIRADAGELPVVELDVPVFEGSEYDGEALVHVDPGVRELLLRAGWTPPDQDGATRER